MIALLTTYMTAIELNLGKPNNYKFGTNLQKHEST